MASKRITRKNTSGTNQPTSCEVKDSVSNKLIEFHTFDIFERYSAHISSQSTPDPIYTSSPKTPNLNLDSSSDEELRGVTLEDPLHHIPNNEVDQLCHHTQAYLQSIGQIPIIYQIPRSRATRKRTQAFGEDESLTSGIKNLIIDTISKIRQLIASIVETKEYLEFQNLLDSPEGDSTFYDSPKAQASGFGALKPPKTNPPCTNPPSPRLNFNFLSNMEAKRPWLVIDSIVVPGSQHPFPKHPKKLLPKFDLDNCVSPEDHIKQFMLSLKLMDVQLEYVVFKLFLYTFGGKVFRWFFSLTARSITSWKQFETTFLTQFGDDKTYGVLFLELSMIKFSKKEKIKVVNQRFINLLN